MVLSMPFFGEAVTVSFIALGTCSMICSSAPWSGITSYLGRRKASVTTSLAFWLSLVSCFITIFPGLIHPRQRLSSSAFSLGPCGFQLLFRVLRLEEDPVGHSSRDHALRTPDLELGAKLGVLDGNHGEPDVLVQARRVAGGRDLADLLAILVDWEEVGHRAVVVGAELLAADLDPHKLAGDSLLAHPPQRLLADEVRLLVELDHPLVAVADLVGILVYRHVAAVGEDTTLDPAYVGRPDG